jgi:histidinol-phosphate aminotransferase
MKSEEVYLFNPWRLVRRNILTMKAYSSAREEFKGNAEILLDANENPFASGYNRYPDPSQLQLKQKVAKIKNVAIEQIFFGNGSDEAIDLLIRIFCEPYQDSIIIAEPTYGMYSVCAEVSGVKVKSVTLTSEFELDDQAVLSAADATTKLLFLCSPNNPSGNLLSRSKVENILRNFPGIVVLDEAYIDFSSAKSFVEELNLYPNLVVLQTFSKAWGLAGLRLGMAFASADIITLLNKIKPPYNVNDATQSIILEALNHHDQKNIWVEEIIRLREKLTVSLATLSVVERVFLSDANFLLVRVNNATSIYQHLLRKNIIVRNRSTVRLCDNCLRITVGTAIENERLIQAIKQL